MPAEPVAPAKPVKPVKPRSAFTPGYSSAYRADTPGNEDSKQAILDSMMPGQKYTITDIIMSCPQVADLTNQRVAALVRQLVMSGDVIRTEDERKAYFELP